MAAKRKPFIKWLPKMIFSIIFDKIVHYYLEFFFICLDLCCIHTITRKKDILRKTIVAVLFFRTGRYTLSKFTESWIQI